MFPGQISLPRAAPLPALALGAYLKNTACRLDGVGVRGSAVHGDLGEVDACLALDAAAQALATVAGAARLAAIAHDLHPDFHSTRLAQSLADDWGVPVFAVQHHRAHLGVVQAEMGLRGAVLGLALDGVGLGSDGQAWGGELLWADDPARSSDWRRLAHLPPLALPGGDRAAREPWRVAAGLLWARGQGERIAQHFEADVGTAAVRTVRTMLERQLNCPSSTSAGRWFDAAAAALGLHIGLQGEAEAAICLEHAATEWLADHPAPADQGLPLPELVCSLFDVPPARRGEGAARFHIGLAAILARAVLSAAQAHDVDTMLLTGGCFFNRLLSRELTTRLEAAGLRVLRPGAAGCGDAGLSLGQAWLASWAAARHDDPIRLSQPRPEPSLEI
jgi:hydrogenase maturation protein HypF